MRKPTFISTQKKILNPCTHNGKSTFLSSEVSTVVQN